MPENSATNLQKAIFLDRDGVINIDHGYTHKIEDFTFIDGVFHACRRFQAMGYAIVVVTNQSGIARGYYSEADFERLTDWMLQRFAEEGVDVLAVYHCPHHAKEGYGEFKLDCDCRKPKPGMLIKAANEHHLDLSQSVIVGDKISDMRAGRAAQLSKCILITSTEPKANEYTDAWATSLVHVRI